MLLFKSEHLPAIYSGLKVRTRRLWKKQRVKVGSIQAIKLKLFEKENHGFIFVTNVRQENLLDITEQEAYLEGGYSRESYLEKWFEISVDTIS